MYEYPTNVTNFLDLLRYMNKVTEGWGATLIAIAIFFVAFFSLKTYPTPRAFASASFIAFISVLIFFILKLVDLKILIISILMVIAGIIWLIFGEKIEFG